MATAQASNKEQLENLYKSLLLKKDESTIRVADILPGCLDAEIKVVLRVVNLDASPYYEALSYSWGQSTKARTIIVNEGYRLATTDNAFNALKRLRKRINRRTIWVDQICIDQSNIAERSHQVSIMGMVYREAALVNIWIGEPNIFPKSSPLAPFTYMWREYREYGHSLSGLVRKKNRARIVSALENTSPHWHKRAWTLQEYLFARTPYICCGKYRWRADSQWLLDIGDFSLRLHSVATYSERSRTTDVDILLATGFCSGLDATDERDHVFSKLGIINRAEASIIGSDYSLSSAEIFALATYANMHCRRNFDSFDIHVRNDKDRVLPSWCIDFSSCDYGILDYSQDYLLPGHYSECAISTGRGPLTRIATSLSSDNKLLTIPATSVDVIVAREKFWSATLQPGPASVSTSSRNAHCEKVSDLLRNSIRSIMSVQDVKLAKLFTSMFDYTGKASLDHQSLDVEVPRLTRVSEEWLDSSRPFALAVFKHWNELVRSQGLIGNHELFEHSTKWNALETKILWDRISRPNDQLSFISTSSGVIGLASETVLEGDIVVLLKSHSPFVALRQSGVEYTYQGQLYLHGFSTEKIFPYWWDLGIEDEPFVLR